MGAKEIIMKSNPLAKYILILVVLLTSALMGGYYFGYNTACDKIIIKAESPIKKQQVTRIVPTSTPKPEPENVPEYVGKMNGSSLYRIYDIKNNKIIYYCAGSISAVNGY